MPSPIAHGATSYLIYRAFAPKLAEENGPNPWSRRRVLIFVLALTFLPDIDIIPGLLFGDLRGFHNNIANSLFVGISVAFVVGLVLKIVGRQAYRIWFAVALLSYWLHVFMDFLSADRGVMMLWPFTSSRFVTPAKLFYGLHYSEGLLSVHHLWTIVSELAFSVLIIGIAWAVGRKKSTRPNTLNR